MKKNIVIYTVATSFILGLITHQFEQSIPTFLILLCSGLMAIYFKKIYSQKNSNTHKIHPRTQFWDNIYFYLLTLNFTLGENELRVWGANIEDTEDFEAFVRLAEQVALKSGVNLKMLVTDHDNERLEKLTESHLAKKVRFANVNLSDNTWPFKNKFNLVYIGKIKTVDVAKKSFHNRLETCLYHNSALIVNPLSHGFFFKKGWQQMSEGILMKNHDRLSSNSSGPDLSNDIQSNFI